MKLYTTKVVAEWLDLSERRVRELRSTGIVKEDRPGLFRLKSAVHDYINYLRNNNPKAEGVEDYNLERAKLMKAKRETVELELQLRKREVHTSEEVEFVMSDMLVRFRTRLMAIPAKKSAVLAVKTEQTEIFRILKEAIEEALEELSDYDTAFEERKEDGEADTQSVQEDI